MDVANFKAIIEANGGESALVSITFDGGSSRTFVREEDEYTHAKYLDEANSVLNFTEIDFRGNAFIVSRPIEVVHGMCFAAPGVKRTSFDPAHIRGL